MCTATPQHAQLHQYSNPHSTQNYRFTSNNSPGRAIHISDDEDLNQSSSAAAASSGSTHAQSSSAAAAPAKAKANEPVHSLSGKPPPPHANIPKYKLQAELANAYAKGLITDPEDKKEYEEFLKDKQNRTDNDWKKDTSGITKSTLVAIYRRIYPKIKDR